jgi:hypothetical protein
VRQFNDTVLLGLKGQLSEAELHLIRSRLVGGLRNTPKRGESRRRCRSGLIATTTTGSCCARRPCAPRDRAAVLPVAGARVRQAGRARADRRRAAPATPGRSGTSGSGGRVPALARRTTSSATRLTRARSRSAASASGSTSMAAACRPGRRPTRGVVRLHARSPSRLMSAGMSTWPRVSGCGQT